jgi:hypothetical protein
MTILLRREYNAWNEITSSDKTGNNVAHASHIDYSLLPFQPAFVLADASAATHNHTHSDFHFNSYTNE